MDEETWWLTSPEFDKSFEIDHLDPSKIVIGLRFNQITSSKFCGESLIKELTEQRSKYSKPKCIGPCHLLEKQKDYPNRDFIKMIALQNLYNIFPLLEKKTLFFGDFTLKKGNITNYILETFGTNFKGYGISSSFQFENFSEISQKVLKNDATAFQIWKQFEDSKLSFQEKIDFFEKFINSQTNNQKLNIVFGDISAPQTPSESKELELIYQKNFVQNVILAFTTLGQNGNFVLKIFDTWTRFSVGLLHMLHKYFRSISIVKPFSSCILNSEKFLLCFGFFGSTSTVIKFLLDVYAKLDSVEFTTQNVVQILSPSVLVKTWSKFVKWNDYFANREIVAFKEFESNKSNNQTKEEIFS